MAEQLEEFNFGRMRGRGRGSYDIYLEIEEGETEGPIWKLSSEDSPSGTADIRSMQTSIAGVALRKGLKIRTNVITEEEPDPDDDSNTITVEYLILQAYINGEETDSEDE